VGTIGWPPREVQSFLIPTNDVVTRIEWESEAI
jgi:hypothetical protein